MSRKDMDLQELFEHFLYIHDLYWGGENEDDDDYSTFKDWAKAYNKAINHDPDIVGNEEEEIHQPSENSSESSSSESSSEEESKPQKQKKRKRLRESDKLKKQVSDVIEKVDDNHQ